MNKLAGATTYLAGAMDRVKDGGVGWRNMITPFLESLGVRVLDPCKKPVELGLEDESIRKEINRLKIAGEFDKIRELYGKIRSVDLRCVDESSFLVVNIDPQGHLCGTYEELFWANRCKKPILCHVEGGKETTPNWLLFTLPHQYFFGDWGELFDHLDQIDKGNVPEWDTRWVFFKWNTKR